MKVYLVRHGDALSEQKDPSRCEPERFTPRPLSEKGRAEVLAAAQELKAEGAQIDEIWHSVKLRAKQTAEIIADVLNVKAVIEKPGLKPNDPVLPVAEELRKTEKTILIAGHGPFLPKLAALLKTGNEENAVAMKSGGVVRVS